MFTQKKYFVLSISLCLTVFLFSCDESPTSENDINSLDFNIIVDSSFYTLSATHNSHIYGYEELSINDLVYTPVFNLTLKLNEPSRRDEIKKIVIYDDQEYGWEFSKKDLESYFSSSDSTFSFNNLLFKPSYELTDRLFFVRVIGEENQSSLDYNFIFKGEYPAFLRTNNYWISSEYLEVEFYNDNYSRYNTGYNPLLNPDTVSLVWLDTDKKVLSITPQIKNEVQQTAFSRYFYSYTVKSSVPDKAMYVYSIVSENKFNNKYQLKTSVDPTVNRLPLVTEFFELNKFDQKIIYADNETAIFLTPSSIDQNQYSSLLIYDITNNNELTEITIFGRFSAENNLVHYNSSLQNLYFFDQNREGSYYNINTQKHSKLDFSTTSYPYHNYIFPFGDLVIYYDRNSNGHLFNILTNEVTDINLNISFRDYSYYYSSFSNALFLGTEDSRAFIKVTTMDSVTFTGEINYRDNNLSSYSNSKSRLHYSSSDSSLIHSSGAILSIKESVSFEDPSALTSIPFIESFASGWIDQEQLLFVLDNQSNERIRVLKKEADTFSEYGYLETFGNPLDIFIHDQTIKISSYYNQGSRRDAKTILISYSLDDIVQTSEMEKVNSTYKKMRRVSF